MRPIYEIDNCEFSFGQFTGELEKYLAKRGHYFNTTWIANPSYLIPKSNEDVILEDALQAYHNWCKYKENEKNENSI